MRRNPVAAAREAVIAAEEHHETAKGEHAAAIATRKAAERAYGDSPGEDTRRALAAAKEAASLAKLRAEGAARKLAAAQAGQADAEAVEARRELAAAVPMCERSYVFDHLAGDIATIAAVDAVARVDVHEGTPRVLRARLARQNERDERRALALRNVRAAVDAQHNAVGRVVAASAVLGQEPPAVAVDIEEEHVLAAVALEVWALGRPESVDSEALEPWWGRFVDVAPGITPGPVADYLEWARASVRLGRPAPMHEGRLDTPEAMAERAALAAEEERQRAAAEAVERTKRKARRKKRRAREEREAQEDREAQATVRRMRATTHNAEQAGIAFGLH